MKDRDRKAAFRRTKEWKMFRKYMFDKQEGKDYITGKKLYKRFNVHHCNMSVDDYDKLVEDNFVALNSQMHDTVHILFRYYQKDKTILDRLKQVLDKMVELNK